MRDFVLLVTLPLLVVMFSLSPFAQSAESISPGRSIQVRVPSWFVEPSGDVKVEDGGIATEIDLEDDLDLGDDTSYGLQVLFRPWGSTILAFGYQPVSLDGRNTITRAIEFGGTTYIVGADVDSELDLKFYDFDFRRAIIQQGASELCWGAGVSLIDVEVSLEGDTGAGVVKEDESAIVPVPILAFAGRFQPIDYFYVRAEVRGVFAGSYAHIADGEAAVGVNITDYFNLEGGFKIFDFSLDVQDVDAGLTLDGLFISGVLQF